MRYFFIPLFLVMLFGGFINKPAASDRNDALTDAQWWTTELANKNSTASKICASFSGSSKEKDYCAQAGKLFPHLLRDPKVAQVLAHMDGLQIGERSLSYRFFMEALQLVTPAESLAFFQCLPPDVVKKYTGKGLYHNVGILDEVKSFFIETYQIYKRRGHSTQQLLGALGKMSQPPLAGSYNDWHDVFPAMDSLLTSFKKSSPSDVIEAMTPPLLEAWMRFSKNATGLLRILSDLECPTLKEIKQSSQSLIPLCTSQKDLEALIDLFKSKKENRDVLEDLLKIAESPNFLAADQTQKFTIFATMCTESNAYSKRYLTLCRSISDFLKIAAEFENVKDTSRRQAVLQALNRTEDFPFLKTVTEADVWVKIIQNLSWSDQHHNPEDILGILKDECMAPYLENGCRGIHLIIGTLGKASSQEKRLMVFNAWKGSALREAYEPTVEAFETVFGNLLDWKNDEYILEVLRLMDATFLKRIPQVRHIAFGAYEKSNSLDRMRSIHTTLVAKFFPYLNNPNVDYGGVIHNFSNTLADLPVDQDPNTCVTRVLEHLEGDVMTEIMRENGQIPDGPQWELAFSMKALLTRTDEQLNVIISQVKSALPKLTKQGPNVSELVWQKYRELIESQA